LPSSETSVAEKLFSFFLSYSCCSELKKVPELFRSLGKGVTEFRKAKNDWEQDISEVMNQDPIEDHDFKKTDDNKPEASDTVSQEGEKQTVS